MSERDAPKKSDEEKNFIEVYAPLVKRIAHHLLSRLPQSIQLDDLIQAGMIGLLEAHRNFDSTKGASFSTYAGIRIRGAMLDEIRRGDWAPRSVHRNTRRVGEAIKEIEHHLGRDAKPKEIAELLGISIEEYHQIAKDSNGVKVYGFDDLGIQEDNLQHAHTASSSLLDALHNENFRNYLAKEISKLPDREKLVLALYYDEELNLREVGEVMGVSESRISQIHSQAMGRLQGKMKTWKPS